MFSHYQQKDKNTQDSTFDVKFLLLKQRDLSTKNTKFTQKKIK